MTCNSQRRNTASEVRDREGPDLVVFAFTVSLQDEDGDLPRRQRLQFDVVGISFGSPLPPLFSLGPMNLAGRQLEHLVAVLHRDLRVGTEVVDPGGVLRLPPMEPIIA